MIRGLYSAATALDSHIQHQDVIAHNLAHANVPGYRRRGVTMETFESSLTAASQDNSGHPHGTRISQPYVGFEPGTIEFTGNPFDVAIRGDSFFVIQGPDGPLYTRNGSFTLGQDGKLTTRDGLPVLGAGGPLTLPTNAAAITITADGQVSADNNIVGQIRLARFADPSRLTPAGTTFFEALDRTSPEPSTDTVQQGYREGSNVQVVSEMVSLISALRHYEASQRALRTIGEAVQQNTRPQGA